MSEEQVVQETQEFASVGEFVEFLKTVTDETVDVAYVVENLEAIANKPVQTSIRRGQLSGLSLEDMTDEQLKREIINANSVLYKAVQRKASAETIAKNQARVDAAKAEKAKREPEKATTDVVDGETVTTSTPDAEGAAAAEESTVVDTTPETTDEHPVEDEL
ncbi:hypothetical protein D3C75_158610 [compost metagenome]